MSTRNNDIAVIGIGCRFPDADNGDAFFRNLMANRDSVREIPPERWSHADLYAQPGEEGRLSSKWGGFIAGVDEFDARFFKILPSEAELMDPQQKLFLTCSWEALEDAGYARRQAVAGRRVGVYAGVTWNEFALVANEYGYLRDRGDKANALYWGIPNRVSYFFDFVGPSIAVDTACSSSLVAVHLAAQSLISGECEMALAGAVNLNLHPAKYLFLSSSGFLSTEGKCRGFGEGGNGYVPSEGVAVLVLKTLAAAEAAGDRIYGVIKGTAINHGGKVTGYTVPNPRAHQTVIQAALAQAGVAPREIGYVECHGTGTALGDPIELSGLKLAFEAATPDKQFCAIGTVKSNIGHCEATAGIAGLIKILYSMQAGVIPATLHAETPNRHIDFKNSPFYLARQNTPWPAEKDVRLAGLSSFGAGGSNAHCVIQSYGASPATAVRSQPAAPVVLTVSALNRERVLAYCRELRLHLTEQRVALEDLCLTLRQRENFEYRMAFVVDSVESFVALLDELPQQSQDEKLMVSPGLINADVQSLTGLARQWVENRIRLKDLPVPSEGAAVRLPTYAFEKVRSWIHDGPCLYRRNRHPNPLHPLIDENVSSVGGGAYLKTLHRDEYYLAEHWVEGHPVLPGVCLVEMASAAARRYLGAPVGLFDVWFLEPVSLREQACRQVRVEIETSDSEGRFQTLSGDGKVKHVSGKVRLGGERQDRKTDLQAVLSRCAGRIIPDHFYSRFALSGIIQRGRFRLVADFRHNEMEAVATLHLSDKCREESAFGMHPTLLDGAVQTAMMHLYQRQPETETVLPFQIGACIQHHPLTAKVFVVAVLKNLTAKRYDIEMCDEAGNVLVELKDFVLRDYKEKRRDLSPLLFSTVVRELPALAASAGSVLAGGPQGVILMSGSTLLPQDFPETWAKFSWHAGVPGSDLAGWLEAAQQRIPRLAIVLDGPRKAVRGAELFRCVEDHARTLFEIAGFLASSKKAVEVVVCIRGGKGAGGALAQADLAFVKCLNLELSDLRFRVLELPDDMSGPDMAAIFAAEFGDAGAEVYVRYAGGRRFTEGLEAQSVDAANPGVDDVPAWIVTGAGGGLGRLAARELLSMGKRVVLLGRSPLSEAAREVLEPYPAEAWEYLQCDLTNPLQVESALEQAVSRFGKEWGIIHCAGSIEDGAFLAKKWPAFERVVRAKVESLLLLCAGLQDCQVRRIALFSSITALMGNKGQTDYGFANGFLDGFAALAAEATGSHPVVTVMDWPYWQEGGMQISAERLPAYSDYFLTQPLPTDVGCQMLQRLLAGASARLGVLYTGVPLEHVAARLLLKPLPEVHAVVPTQVLAQPVSRTEGGVAGKDAIQHYLLNFLETHLKLVLGDDDIELPLADLGVDSIAQMDLITWLEKEKRFADLPQSLIVENASIAGLVLFFHENYPDADYSVSRA